MKYVIIIYQYICYINMKIFSNDFKWLFMKRICLFCCQMKINNINITLFEKIDLK